jgi:Zn-dependent peptidase ImmA (M78 family)
MVELETGRTFAGVPYITYDALDGYAEKLVADFAPELLDSPGIVNVEAFVEFYLGLSMRYFRLSYERRVLGMTAFNDGILDIVDEETGRPDSVPVTTGTVILDTSLTAKRNLPRLRFTTMHEGAHWMIHREAFAKDNPFGPVGIYENQFLAAKEGRLDYTRSTLEKTAADHMERQADFLSSAILMPRPALREAYREFFRYYGEKPRRIIKNGANSADDCYAAMLPEYVAGLFGVSKRAALIRLEKLTAIVDNRTWRGAR